MTDSPDRFKTAAAIHGSNTHERTAKGSRRTVPFCRGLLINAPLSGAMRVASPPLVGCVPTSPQAHGHRHGGHHDAE